MSGARIHHSGRGFESRFADFQQMDSSVQGPSSVPKRTQDISPGLTEFTQLLGPLVSPLLQDSHGALDLNKLPQDSFEEFRAFLITQVKVDGIAFNGSLLASYHAVLSDDRHLPLLQEVYGQALQARKEKDLPVIPYDGTTRSNARGLRDRSASPSEAVTTPVGPRGSAFSQASPLQLTAFTADWIAVSAERFASHHLRTPEGRARLSNVLLDTKSFSHDLRSDLVKGIALSGRNFGTSREAYRRLNQEISVWNYTNTSVTKDELSRATHITLDILQEVAVQQEESQELHLRYLKRPKDIVRFSGLEKTLNRSISDEAIQAKAEYIDWNHGNYDPKIALAVKLDELWLTLIDDTRWQQSGSHKTAKNAAFVLKEVEGLREKLGEVKTEAEFLEIAEDIRTLLKGGIGVTGTGTLRSIKDFTASSTVPGMFKDLPEVHRQAYDQLLQFAEELHYAKEMGETIEIGQNFDLKTPKKPEQSAGKAGAVAGGEVREPTGGTSLAPGPQARDSLLPQVKLAGLPQGDSATNVDLASLPNKEIPTNTDLAILPKGNRTTNADLAVLSNIGQPPSVIPAQFPPVGPSKKEDPAKTNEDQQKRFTEAKTQFIHGLKQQKRSLWYQYKQHKALSRGISQAAQLIGQGDIQEIKAGQQALDKIIEQVEQAEDESQLKTQVQELQTQLKTDGALHQAMIAAEMDGTEQLIGLGQTILIIMATRQLGRGMARLSTAIAETQTGQRLANLATQIRQHQLGQSIHRGMQNNVLTWRASKGFALGAWISTAENGIAAATDEVNPEGAHANSWALDALATGAAMGLFTTAASYMGNSIEKNLLQRMMGRYFGSTKAPLRIIGDALAETGEEVVDATLRAKLEDADKDLGFDQFREIAMVSGLGGFTKTGMVAEMLRGNSRPSLKEIAPTDKKATKPINYLPYAGLVMGLGFGGMGPIKKAPKEANGKKTDLALPTTDAKISIFREAIEQGRAYGYHNPILKKLPALFPLLHPKRFHHLWNSRLRESFLQPYLPGGKPNGRDMLLFLPRVAGYIFSRAVLETLYLPVWPLGLLSQALKIPQIYRSKITSQKDTNVDGTKKPSALAPPENSENVDNEEFESTEGVELGTTYDQYVQMAQNLGWDLGLTMARGLKRASTAEIELLLTQAFAGHIDRKIRFLHRFPLRNAEPLLKKFIKGYGLNLAFLQVEDLIQAAETLDRFRTSSANSGSASLDVLNSIFLYPHESLSDKGVLSALNYGLKRLKQGNLVQKIGEPPLIWSERPGALDPALRFWSQAGQVKQIPQALLTLRTHAKVSDLRAAIFACAQWGIAEALPEIQALANNSDLAPEIQLSAQQAALKLLGQEGDFSEIAYLLGANPDVQSRDLGDNIWELMGGREAPWEQEAVAQENHSPSERLNVAKSLLIVGQEYGVVEYQLAGVKTLLNLFLDSNSDDKIRQDSLLTLLEAPEAPVEKLLQVFSKWSASPHRFNAKQITEALVKNTDQFLVNILMGQKIPAKNRLQIAELLYPKLSEDQIREVFYPLLADFHVSHLAAETLDRMVPGWDGAIQDFKDQGPGAAKNSKSDSRPGKSNSPGGHHSLMAALPLGLSQFFAAPEALPWWGSALGFLGLGILGATLSYKDKKKSEIDPETAALDLIQKSTQYFTPTLNKKSQKQTLKFLTELLARIPNEESHLFRLLSSGQRFIVNGRDPMVTFSNTGATPSQLISILTGKASGKFPISVDLLAHQDPGNMTRALKSYGLNRQEALLTMQMKIPMSQWIKWLAANKAAFTSLTHNLNNFLNIPVEILTEQIREFGPQGAIKIFSPNSNMPYRAQELAALKSVLGQFGIDESVLLISKGPFFEDVLKFTDAQKDQMLETWGRELNPDWHLHWENQFQAWVDLIFAEKGRSSSMKGEPKPLNQIIEAIAHRHGFVSPSLLVMGEINQRMQKLAMAESSHSTLDQSEKRIPHPTIEYMVEDLLNSKHLAGIPLYAYVSFANLFGVDLRSWLARALQKKIGVISGVEEAMQILFGDLKAEKRPEAELKWVEEFNLSSAIPRIRYYLSQAKTSLRSQALQTLMQVAPTMELPELTGLLERYVDLEKFSPEHVAEFNTWVKALDLFQIPQAQQMRAHAYVRSLTLSKHPEISALAEAAAIKLGILKKLPDYDHEIRSKDPVRRHRALLTIRAAGLSQYQAYVMERIQDTEAEISKIAIHTLGEFGGRDAVDVLKSVAAHSKWNGVRLDALTALGRIGSRYALPEIQKIVKDHHGSKELMMGAFRLMAQLDGKHFAQVMIPYLGHFDPEIRLAAAAALLQTDSYPEAASHFVKNLFGTNKNLFPLATELMAEMKRSQLHALVQVSGKQFLQFQEFLKREGGAQGWKILDRLDSLWDQLAAKNWQWFHQEIRKDLFPFSPKYLGSQIAQTKKTHAGEFGKFLKKALSPAELDKSELRPQWQQAFIETLTMAQRGELTPHHTRIKLMQTLQNDFLGQISQDSQYEIGEYDLRELEELSLSGESLPSWVQDWFRDHPDETMLFPKITLRGSVNHNYESLNDDMELLITLISDLLPAYLGLSHEFFDQTVNGQREIRLIPPTLLFYGFLKGFGGRVNDIEMETHLSTPPQMRTLIGLRRGPLIISNRRLDAEGRSLLHPYLLMLHDAYHFAYNSSHSDQHWQTRMGLIEVFDHLGITHRDPYIQEALINGLMDEGSLGYEDLFSTMKDAKLLTSEDNAELRAHLANHFFAHDCRQNLLAAYDKVFPPKPTVTNQGFALLGLSGLEAWEGFFDHHALTLTGGALLLGGGLYLAMRLNRYLKNKDEIKKEKIPELAQPGEGYLEKLMNGTFTIDPVKITHQPIQPPMPLSGREKKLIHKRFGWEMSGGLQFEDLRLLKIIIDRSMEEDWNSGNISEGYWDLLKIMYRAEEYFNDGEINNPEDLH